MKDHQSLFAVGKMCKTFKVSRSGYYVWLKRKPSTRKMSNQKTLMLIKEVHNKSKGRYGSPKITGPRRLMNSEIEEYIYQDLEWPGS